MIKQLTSLLLVTLLLFLAGCSESPQLKKLPSDAVILALGDSLTYGTGASPDQSYPAILQSFSKRTVINAGVPGETSDMTLLRVKHLLVEHQPALVILCIGGNDILQRKPLEQIKNNIQQLIDAIRGQGSQLILVAVPQFGFYPTAPNCGTATSIS